MLLIHAVQAPNHISFDASNFLFFLKFIKNYFFILNIITNFALIKISIIIKNYFLLFSYKKIIKKYLKFK